MGSKNPLNKIEDWERPRGCGMATKTPKPKAAAESGIDDQTIFDILRILPDLSRALGRSVPLEIRREGISVAQMKALVHLAQTGPQTMSELASGLRITTPSATGLINPLVDYGYVERNRESKDRRVVTVSLSESAKDLSQRLVGLRRAQIEKVLEGMDRKQQQAFVDGLKRLAGVFSGEIALNPK